MKKILLAILCITTLSVTAQTTQRFVLVEEFTNASCGPCALSNPAFETLMNANTSKCVAIKYHTSFPGYDPFYSANPTQNQVRTTYNSVTGVPTARMDGTGTFLQDVNQTSIDAEYATASPFSVTVNWRYSTDGDSIYINASFKALQTISGTLKGHIAVIEKSVHYDTAPGTNGETDFTNVMRKMLPSETGTLLPSTMTTNQTVTVSVGMGITTGFKDISQIGVIAFVQDDATKNIKQSAYAPNPSIQPTNPMVILVSNTGAVCTANGAINISVIGANGTYTYHWSNNTTTQDLTNLNAGTYALTVTSGIKTATASFMVANGVLSAPTNVITSTITSCSTILSWAAKVGASYYQVKYKPSSSTVWSAPTNITPTNYTFTGLSASTQYNFSVAAVCASGSVGSASTYTVTTASCTTPYNPVTSGVTATGAFISWTAGCNANSYELQYQISGSTTWNVVTTTNTSYQLSGLTPSKIYYYKIRTLCGSAYTGFSALKNFVTPATRLEDFKTDLVFQVFPNPVDGIINVSFDNTGLNSPVTVNIYDVLGRLSLSQNNSNIQSGILKLELPSDLASGQYILEIKGDNFSVKKPIVKIYVK
ncbi:MAG: fibronectin type III domain-containing protein [Bacteroidota bacterium]